MPGMHDAFFRSRSAVGPIASPAPSGPARRAVLACCLATLTAAVGCGRAQLGQTIRLRVAGAQIPVELVSYWLSEARSPGFDVTPVAPVYLSQNGYQALRRGECDIACTDRPPSELEVKDFGEARLVGYRVAYYGFGLYVNLDNPVDAIFAGHLKLAMQKRIADWKQLGGREVPVTIYGPQKGTRGGQLLAQQARIWFSEPTWVALDTPEQIVQKVAEDPGALGFAPIGYDGDVRYLGLKMERHGTPALPSLEEIESGEYGYAKMIYVYAHEPPGRAAQAAIDHLLSERGARFIRKTDLWPVGPERARVTR